MSTTQKIYQLQNLRNESKSTSMKTQRLLGQSTIKDLSEVHKEKVQFGCQQTHLQDLIQREDLALEDRVN